MTEAEKLKREVRESLKGITADLVSAPVYQLTRQFSRRVVEELKERLGDKLQRRFVSRLDRASRQWLEKRLDDSIADVSDRFIRGSADKADLTQGIEQACQTGINRVQPTLTKLLTTAQAVTLGVVGVAAIGGGISYAFLRPDVTPPEVSVYILPESPDHTTAVLFVVEADDNVGVDWIELQVNGETTRVFSEERLSYVGGPYEEGTLVTYRAVAGDEAGNEASTIRHTLRIPRPPPPSDVIPPEVAIRHAPESPTAEQRVTFTAEATDNVGVVRTELFVNGETITCEGARCTHVGGPYEEGTTVTYLAAAYDDAGNRALSAPRTVTITGQAFPGQPYGGTLFVCTASDPVAWDPWWHPNGGAGGYVMGSVYERLTGGDWAVDRSEWDFSLSYIPLEYARGYSMEGWESPDPLTYVISLRKGMRFHNKPPVNGREVTADDVKYSIDRLLGLGEFAKAGASPHVDFPAWRVVDSVEVVDRYTFVLNLKEASPLFPEYWGTEEMPWIHPYEVVERYGDGFGWEHAVGHGPFQVTDYVPGSSLSFNRHPDYYGVDEKSPANRIPYVDALKVVIIQDLPTRLAALRTGKIDAHMGIKWMDALSLQETNPEMEWKELRLACQVVDLRWDLAPYDDIRVRRAMQMAIDLEGLAEKYYGGTADSYPFMVSPALSHLWTPLEELPDDCREPFTHDPERARMLLSEAGYPDGFKQAIPLSSAASAEQRDLTELFIAFWQDIGIDTEVKLMEPAAYSRFVSGRQHQVCWSYSCGHQMPIETLGFWYGGAKVPHNFGNVDDPVFNKYVDSIRAEPDPGARNRLYRAAFAYGTCQHFYVAAPCSATYTFWQPWLEGYQGEGMLQAVALAPTWARTWINRDLRFEMTGQRD